VVSFVVSLLDVCFSGVNILWNNVTCETSYSAAALACGDDEVLNKTLQRKNWGMY